MSIFVTCNKYLLLQSPQESKKSSSVGLHMNRIFRQILMVVIAIWVVEGINWSLNYTLNHYGIFPRRASGLIGILAAPFLHANIYHLLNNTLAFICLAGLTSFSKKGKGVFIRLTIFVIFIGGFLTWLFARAHIHIGLSGVIFGYWGFLIANGIFGKSIRSVVLSLAAIFFYGTMIFGILPTSPNISFEGHIFGALSGVIYSYLYSNRKYRNRRYRNRAHKNKR